MKENIEQSRESDAYAQLVNALDQEDKILAEMRAILKNTPDRAKAEQIILEQLASRMDSAMTESQEALRRWRAELRNELGA